MSLDQNIKRQPVPTVSLWALIATTLRSLALQYLLRRRHFSIFRHKARCHRHLSSWGGECLPWSCTPTIIWSIEGIKYLWVEKQEMKKCDAVQRPGKDPKPLNSPYKQTKIQPKSSEFFLFFLLLESLLTNSQKYKPRRKLRWRRENWTISSRVSGHQLIF